MREALIALVRDSGAFDSVLDPDEAAFLVERLVDRIAALRSSQPAAPFTGSATWEYAPDADAGDGPAAVFAPPAAAPATGEGDAGEAGKRTRFADLAAFIRTQISEHRNRGEAEGTIKLEDMERLCKWLDSAAALRAAAQPERGSALYAKLCDVDRDCTCPCADAYTYRDIALRALAGLRTAQQESERVRELEAVEAAAYAMYGVLCKDGTLSDDDPTVAAYVAASNALWADEIAEIDASLAPAPHTKAEPTK